MEWVAIGIIISLGMVWAIRKDRKKKDKQQKFEDRIETFSSMTDRKFQEMSFSSEKTISVQTYTDVPCNLQFDFNKNLIAFVQAPNTIHNTPEKCDIFDYSKMTNVELDISGIAPQSASAGGALVGGVLAGATGAIIGSAISDGEMCDRIELRLYTDDVRNALFAINLIARPIKRNSFEYRTITDGANEAYAILKAYLNQTNKTAEG